jgi:hypothetical protein
MDGKIPAPSITVLSDLEFVVFQFSIFSCFGCKTLYFELWSGGVLYKREEKDSIIMYSSKGGVDVMMQAMSSLHEKGNAKSMVFSLRKEIKRLLNDQLPICEHKYNIVRALLLGGGGIGIFLKMAAGGATHAIK